MATAKKTPAKKPVTRSTKAKKPTAIKATVKKTTAKKTTKVASSKQPATRSFRVAANERSFTDFRITRQTVYWIILIAFIVFAQLWILKLQIEVATLLDAQATELQQF